VADCADVTTTPAVLLIVKAPVDSMIKQASATADAGMLFMHMLIVVKGLSYKEAMFS
jgi:hypothetical protein